MYFLFVYPNMHTVESEVNFIYLGLIRE